MQRTFAFTSALALVALSTTGCATTASNDLRTTGIYAVYTLEQNGPGADFTARAQFRASASNGNLVELSEGESVYVNDVFLANKNKVTGVDINYSQTVPKGAPAYNFEFRRNDGEIAKHDVSPPQEFNITSGPLTGTYASSYTLTWDAGTNGAKVDISARSDQSGCNVLTIDFGLADNGSYTFSGDKLKPRGMDGGAPTMACSYQITLEKKATVAIGAPFKSGTANSVAKRATTLSITP